MRSFLSHLPSSLRRRSAPHLLPLARLPPQKLSGQQELLSQAMDSQTGMKQSRALQGRS